MPVVQKWFKSIDSASSSSAAHLDAQEATGRSSNVLSEQGCVAMVAEEQKLSRRLKQAYLAARLTGALCLQRRSKHASKLCDRVTAAAARRLCHARACKTVAVRPSAGPSTSPTLITRGTGAMMRSLWRTRYVRGELLATQPAAVAPEATGLHGLTLRSSVRADAKLHGLHAMLHNQ